MNFPVFRSIATQTPCSIGVRILTMPPVVSALLAFVASLFRSQTSLRLENLALRHQLAVYQQTIPRPRLSPTDRLVWVWLSASGPAGKLPWHSSNPHRNRLATSAVRDHWRRLSQRGTSGRPAVPREIRDLIRDLSRANPLWGSPRIVGSYASSASRWPNRRSRSTRCDSGSHRHRRGRSSSRNHVKDLIALDFFVVANGLL